MNIRRAQVFIDAVRWAENHPLLSFDMGEWINAPKDAPLDDLRKMTSLHWCGTAACGAGSLALYPPARRMGWGFKNGFPAFKGDRIDFGLAEFLEVSMSDASFFVQKLCWSCDFHGVDELSEVTSQMFLGKFREICGEEIAAQLNWEGRAAA